MRGAAFSVWLDVDRRSEKYTTFILLFLEAELVEPRFNA
jgi:hypothetical protein